MISAYTTLHSDPERINRRLAEVEAVTLDQVAAACAAYLQPGQRCPTRLPARRLAMRGADHRPEVKAATPLASSPSRPTWWLDNGLQVLAFHRPGQHIAAVSLVLDNPLSTEPGDIEGVATITQRCLDEGTAAPSGRPVRRAPGGHRCRARRVGRATRPASCSSRYRRPGWPRRSRCSPRPSREPELRADDVERHQYLRLAEIDHTMANSSNRAQVAFRQAVIPGRFRASRMAGGTAGRRSLRSPATRTSLPSTPATTVPKAPR